MRRTSSTFELSSSSFVLASVMFLATTTCGKNSVSAFVARPNSPTAIAGQHTPTSLFSEPASSSTSYSDFDDDPDSFGLRSSEFHFLEEISHSKARKLRLKKDEQTQARFAFFGDDLWNLRSTMANLSEELILAMSSGNKDLEERIRDQLMAAERRDPELVYELEMAKLAEAEGDNKSEKAKAHRDEAKAARSCLPHMNLEGLWVGKYGNNGYEMINVSYSGDLLTAYKVTGDKNVPRGEITFQADLSPLRRTRAGKEKKELKPIKLTESAAKKWGTAQLPRYSGSGQVAEEGFVNQQWMDGQLIMIGDTYFSFAWLPISHQIFFGRPSPELALKMLREAGNTEVMGVGTPPPAIEDDDVTAMKAFVARCMDETAAHIEDEIIEGKGDGFSCIWHSEATEECYFE